MLRRRIAVLVFSMILSIWAVPQGASAAPKDRVAPTTPSNLVITATTATSVSLAWTASTDNSSTWWYCVQHNGSGCVRVDPPRTTLTWPNLLPDRTHTFSVYAIDLAGNRSANSNTVSYTTPPDTTPPSPAPTAPSNLVITATTATSVSLAWTASTDNSSTWWYCVQHNGSGCVRVDPPRTTVTWPNLLPDRTHTFSVYAVDLAGNRSANSNTVSYTTPPDTTPPSPAPTLSAAAVYPTRVYVAWTQAKDNTSQVWYTLYANGSVVFADQIGLQSWTFLDLQPSSTHTYRVTARDAYFNVVDSNLLTVTTPPKNDFVAPSAPTNLRFNFRNSGNELWLEWDLSTDNSDPQGEIIYYVYQNGVRTDSAGGGFTITYCAEPTDTEVWLTAVDTSGNESGRSNSVFSTCV